MRLLNLVLMELWAHFVQLHWVCSECEVHRMLRNFRGKLVTYVSGLLAFADTLVFTISPGCEAACRGLGYYI